MEQVKIRNGKPVQEDIFNPKEELVVNYYRHYAKMTTEEKMLHNSERVAKNISVIMWAIVIPIIISALGGFAYFLSKVA